MKILIVTQKVDQNDSVLGFFHGWIEEFAKHCEQVTVICLYEGEHNLPKNVKVLSLGKEVESRKSKVESQLKYLINFYKYIIREKQSYDSVFIHMNQIYVILGWPLWKLWNKRIGLWYTHKAVSTSLKIAEKLADVIFTASKQSFRIPSSKVRVMGHGIDIAKFESRKSKVESYNEIFNIITIGRISPVKDYGTLIDAVEILVKEKDNLRVKIIGGAGTPPQESYFRELKLKVKEKGLDSVIGFTGPVPNKDIVGYLEQADLFVNMSLTGSLDKAVLEAMALEIPVITCNEAVIEDVLAEYRNELFFEKGNSAMLSEKIINLMEMNQDDREILGKNLRDIVVKDHNLENLIKNIIVSLDKIG